jgi:hypothetical protein
MTRTVNSTHNRHRPTLGLIARVIVLADRLAEHRELKRLGAQVVKDAADLRAALRELKEAEL